MTFLEAIYFLDEKAGNIVSRPSWKPHDGLQLFYPSKILKIRTPYGYGFPRWMEAKLTLDDFLADD